jgi:hypothetical protein
MSGSATRATAARRFRRPRIFPTPQVAQALPPQASRTDKALLKWPSTPAAATRLTGIAFRRSSDGGATFLAPKNISNIQAPGEIPKIALDGGGNINVVWAGSPSRGVSHIFFSRSTDGGASFSVPATVDTNSSDGYPEVAVDSSGDIDFVWEDNSSCSCIGSEVFFSQSIDGGQSFSTPINLHQQGVKSVQWGPLQIGLDSSGKVALAWSGDTSGGDTPNLWFSRGIASVQASPPLSIDTSSLSGGAVGGAYSNVINANGGTPPYALTVQGLAPGLFMAQSASYPGPSWGSLGTPTVAGTSNESFTVKDSTGFTSTATYSVAIAAAQSSDGGSLNAGNQSTGDKADVGDSNTIMMSRFVTGPKGGQLTSLSVYIASPVDPEPNNQCTNSTLQIRKHGFVIQEILYRIWE